MCPDMTSYCTIEKLTEQYWIWMNRIDKNQVYGPGKLWIYEIGILNKLTWPFFTYDYTITFAKGWDRRTGVFLKKVGRGV